MVKDISLRPYLYIQWFYFGLYFPVFTSFVLVLAIIIRLSENMIVANKTQCRLSLEVPTILSLNNTHEIEDTDGAECVLHASRTRTRTSTKRRDESKYTIAPGILSTSRDVENHVMYRSVPKQGRRSAPQYHPTHPILTPSLHKTKLLELLGPPSARPIGCPCRRRKRKHARHE